MRRGLEREGDTDPSVRYTWVARTRHHGQQSHNQTTPNSEREAGVKAQGHAQFPLRRAPSVGNAPVNACDRPRQRTGVRGAVGKREEIANTAQCCVETHTPHILCKILSTTHNEMGPATMEIDMCWEKGFLSTACAHIHVYLCMYGYIYIYIYIYICTYMFACDGV